MLYKVPYLLVVVTACLLTAQCNVSCQLLHLCTQEAVNTYTHVWKTKTPSLSYHQNSMGFLLIGTSKTMVVYVQEGVKIRKNRLYLFRAAALFVCKYKNRRLKKIQKKWLGEKKNLYIFDIKLMYFERYVSNYPDNLIN